jgi:hypothetical protein
MRLNNIGSNQTSISTNNGTEVFFSYTTPVAAFVPGRGYIRTDRSYSVTTSRHINAWAGRNAEAVPQAEIDGILQGIDQTADYHATGERSWGADYIRR